VIVLVVDDTKPDINIRLTNLPASVTATAVVFRLQKPDGTVAEVSLAENGGRWVGSFGIGDLSESGRCLAEVKATLSNGGVQHGRDPIEVVIRPEFFKPEQV
jgi:hypothetical protein